MRLWRDSVEALTAEGDDDVPLDQEGPADVGEERSGSIGRGGFCLDEVAARVAPVVGLGVAEFRRQTRADAVPVGEERSLEAGEDGARSVVGAGLVNGVKDRVIGHQRPVAPVLAVFLRVLVT